MNSSAAARVTLAIGLIVFATACVGEAEMNDGSNPDSDASTSDMAATIADVGDEPGDDGLPIDMPSTDMTADLTQSDMATEDMTSDMIATDMGGADMGSTDMGGTDVGGADMGGMDMGGMDMGPVFTCVDIDQDGYYVDCADYQTYPGPDCNDNDVNNWSSCTTCVDGDNDTYYAGCDRYRTIAGPDCNDMNMTIHPATVWHADADGDGFGSPTQTMTQCPAPIGYVANGTDCNDGDITNWDSCATCVDGDNDGYYRLCDSYDGKMGPDCSDNDPNNWSSCATCADADSDTFFAGCDRYSTINGPDCNDMDVNNWSTCGGCVDMDGDTWFTGCNNYTNINGPDCSDSDPNNWSSCSTCVDTDVDNYFTGCDRYSTISGPDCGDGDRYNWTSCSTCVDADNDTYFVGCDSYAMPEDCNDMLQAQNPGATEIHNNAIDDDCDPATPDVQCTYVPNPSTNPEPGLLAGIVASHNYWRWRVDVPALQWNATLAASAQAYADRCIWAHDANRSKDGFVSVGENLYATSAAPTQQRVLASVTSWASERADYDYGDVVGMSGPVVGHYTQIVWDDSTDIGCGYTYCSNPTGLPWANATILVCRYGPAGNYYGQAPYGDATGQCLDLDNDDVLQGSDTDDHDRTVQ